MDDVKERPYVSPLREAQAARTRLAVIDAARHLFLEQGYASTTVDQIAKLAGVSKPTVFSSVGSKAAIFKAVRDVAMAGDDGPAPVLDRPSVDRARKAASAEEAIHALASHISALQKRYGLIDAVLSGAAACGDPELLELWETAEAQRRTGAGFLIEIVAAKGRLSVDPEEAADRLSTFMAPDNYRRLVRAGRWSDDDYREWLAHTLTHQLLLSS
ncbi:hypothetical protein Back2_07170 [Nocardioides baekrokdamisoli]|uniref:HTH tetR-type domain-containing protein n=1 Tax=Nocardioides baekrokdamisoli TaxID=1804624 RepID=A0A3G9IC05_9ACTN|nr:TetR/AcrR family transcriptional regulator [Nocardioides baekrokdamisoli]BBH16430.1 hypothetical protein Back2_07170 [Nocardioides baekrokdamisoli]